MSTLSPRTTILSASASDATPAKLQLYYLIFFLSGFPALIYQIVWQRALFTLYGTNVQSVTMIVTVFMLGLGLGGMAGGWLSARPGIRLLLAFGTIELLVGAFGFVSLRLFHRVASLTAGASTAETGFFAFGLLLFPTLMMGSSLPLLVEYFVRRTGNVGESMGILYSVNTLGSGVACFAAALFLMRWMGEAGSVRLAVGLNCFVGITALLLQIGDITPVRRERGDTKASGKENIPFWIGMLLAGATGFIALAYEIVWYRLYSFVSASRASAFAALLAFYLLGIGYSSLAVHDGCKRELKGDIPRTLRICSDVVVLGTIAAFLLGPALAHAVVYVPYYLTYVFVFIAAALLGAAFPLLAHAAIGPTWGTGKHIGLLYLSNIIGATLGSFLVGFVILDFWSTRVTSLFLLFLGLLIAFVLFVLSGRKDWKGVFVGGSMVCVLLAFCSGPLFSGMYERMLYKGQYKRGMQFADIVENRNGVIAVDPNGIVFGEGAYDGHFNTDLVLDSNGLFRAFALVGLHPNPKKVLIIGLSSGSWVQVVASDPDIEEITVVEINPGYLPLIRKHKDVVSLLRNPKVHIVIDDGRRWLVGHPDRKFDFILMNTTFNWRANTSNLLSTEFMGLLRSHLDTGGIAYYNTTLSPEALATGATTFPYALRIWNFIAVSDSPFTLDENRWKTKLVGYKIDGRPVLDLTRSPDRQKLNWLLHLADTPGPPGRIVESRESMLRRLKGVRLITDDNMGTEWR